MSYIELKNISKSYKNKKIFDGLSLNIEKGKFISIIGSYGCGKSTLLKMIAGIEKIDSGKILIDNFLPIELKKSLKIGFAFQEPMLLPWRKVINNITLPLEIENNNKIERLMNY